MLESKAQSFNDGVCTVYSVKNMAENGNTPIHQLVKKVGPLRYEERTVGVSRFYEAAAKQERIDRVLRVLRREEIGVLDVCIPKDGKQYQIKQVQYPQSVIPPVADLALERVESEYEFAKGP